MVATRSCTTLLICISNFRSTLPTCRKSTKIGHTTRLSHCKEVQEKTSSQTRTLKVAANLSSVSHVRTAFCVQLFFNITLAIVRVKIFRFSNFRGPRPTANIAKIKLQQKISGSTVHAYNIQTKYVSC